MQSRRHTFLANALSKKFEHFRAAIGLSYAYSLLHKTIRRTRALTDTTLQAFKAEIEAKGLNRVRK